MRRRVILLVAALVLSAGAGRVVWRSGWDCYLARGVVTIHHCNPDPPPGDW
jgi:hypothetical protein